MSMELLHFDSFPTHDYLDYIYMKHTPTNHIQRSALKQMLRRVIDNELSPHQRQIINLYFYEGYCQSEIADILRINKATVSRGINRALVTLRRYMGYCWDVLKIVPIDWD